MVILNLFALPPIVGRTKKRQQKKPGIKEHCNQLTSIPKQEAKHGNMYLCLLTKPEWIDLTLSMKSLLLILSPSVRFVETTTTISTPPTRERTKENSILCIRVIGSVESGPEYYYLCVNEFFLGDKNSYS
jgi:hypothetical protein